MYLDALVLLIFIGHYLASSMDELMLFNSHTSKGVELIGDYSVRPSVRPSIRPGSCPEASKTSDYSKAVEHFRK